VRIQFDENVCASMGMCEAAAEDLFQIGDDGYLTITDTTPPEDRRAEVEEAVRTCPTGALTLVD
jgi:ferredoxin